MAYLVDSNYVIVGTNSSQAAFYTSADVEDPLSLGLQDYCLLGNDTYLQQHEGS
jgi:hypothetical protein